MKNRISPTLFRLSFILSLIFCSSSTIQAQTPVSLDPTWDTDGMLVADGSRLAEQIVCLDDGKTLVSCNPFGNSSAYIRRYNVDGTQDLTFGTNGKFTVQVAERRTGIYALKEYNGNIFICGTTTTNIGGTNTYAYVAAIQGNGSGYLSSFATNGVKKFDSGNTDFYKVADLEIDPSGNLYLVGLEWLDNLYVLKLSPTGTLDPSFDTDGVNYIPTNNNDHWFEPHDINLDKEGKVVITGKKYRANNGTTIPPFSNFLVARFNTNGSLDNTFAAGGIGLYNSAPSNFDDAERIHVTPNNNYLISGKTYDGDNYDYTALKLTNAGIVDPSFATNGWALEDLYHNKKTENCLNSALLPDGRLLLTGNHGTGDTVYFAMLMLNPDGSRDNVFAPDGVFRNIFNQNNNSSSKGLALDSDGKIVLGGYTRTCANGVCGPLYMALSRYNNTFGTYIEVEEAGLESLSLFPNPVKSGEVLALEGLVAEEVSRVELMDISGKLLKSFNGEKLEFTIPEVESGLYFVRVWMGNRVWVEKIVVNPL